MKGMSPLGDEGVTMQKTLPLWHLHQGVLVQGITPPGDLVMERQGILGQETSLVMVRHGVVV